MAPYFGDYPEDHAEIRIPFNTFDSNDPSASVTITDLADADIEVHADGDVTPIATDGASVIIDFAGETGSHMILIDSSVDAAYTTATEYAVKIVGTTVDGATINAWVGTFSIERAGGALALIKLITAAGPTKTEMDTAHGLLATSDQVNAIGASSGGSVNINATFDNTTTDTIDNAGAVDKGGGLVGIPVTGHAFSAGREVTIAATTNYNGSFTIISQTTNEVVITSSFTSETFGGSETIISTIKTVPFVGSVQSGTFVSTEAQDGVLHDIDDVGDDIDIVYGFNVGGGRTAASVDIAGFIQGSSDEMRLVAYDHVGDAWDTILVVGGQNSTFVISRDAPLLLRHTGTGTDLGDVYIRIDTASTTPSNLSTDKLLVSAVVIGQSVGYSQGAAVHVDTNGGTAGTEAFVNGVGDKPSLLMADAFTLAADVGLVDFHIINGSAITPASSVANKSFFGDHWTMALNGQAAGGLYCQGAEVSGTATSSGEEMHFEGCDFGTVSVQRCHGDKIGFSGTTTHTLAADYNYHGCYSKGASVPVFAKTAGQTIVLEFIDYEGDITVNGLQTGDTVELGGFFRTITLTGDVGAVVHVHGHYQTISSGSYSGTLDITGAIQTADVAAILAETAGLDGAAMRGTDSALTDKAGFSLAATGLDLILVTSTFVAALIKGVWDRVNTGATHNITNSTGKQLRETSAWTQIDGTVVDISATTGQFDTSLTDVDNFHNDSLIVMTGGDLAGQSRPIKTFLNTNGNIAVDELWTSAAANGDSFQIISTHIHPITMIQGAILDDATPFSGADIAATLADTNALVAKLVGITLLSEWLGMITGKQTGDATALTELKATGAGSGTYNPTTDSVEALRDRGDAAWPTATGFNTVVPDAAGVVPTAVENRQELDSNSTQLAALILAVVTNAAGDDVSTDVVALKAVADAIKLVTDKMVFTKTNELDVNTKSLNDAEVIGDGNAIPWDGV